MKANEDSPMYAVGWAIGKVIIKWVLNPLLMIFMLNALFPLEIEYGLYEWLAAGLLADFVGRKNETSKD